MVAETINSSSDLTAATDQAAVDAAAAGAAKPKRVSNTARAASVKTPAKKPSSPTATSAVPSIGSEFPSAASAIERGVSAPWTAAFGIGTMFSGNTLDEVANMTDEQFKTFNETLLKGYEELVSFQKDSLNAVMKSQAILVKGNEEISKDLFALTQASIDETVSLAKAFAGCKTLQDVIDVQRQGCE